MNIQSPPDGGLNGERVLIDWSQLNSPQGIGKSTFFARLGGKWFSDSLTISDMRDKAAAEKLQGYWILELCELAGTKRWTLKRLNPLLLK